MHSASDIQAITPLSDKKAVLGIGITRTALLHWRIQFQNNVQLVLNIAIPTIQYKALNTI